jgi:dihydropteroate synthase
VEEFGADIINDVSGGTEEMFRLVAGLHVVYLLMSSDSTTEAVGEMFSAKTAELNNMGCDNIILDPGYGFGKDIVQNYSILRQQSKLRRSHYPLLAGVSRKRMVWQLLGCTPDEALNGTTVVNAVALQNGADILRVHDVRQAKETIKIIEACSCISE